MYHNNFVAVVVSNGDILREFEGDIASPHRDTVRIPFGSEYSLRFKNKDSRKAVVSVDIDGEDVTKGGRIIVPGGETVDLEGFMGVDGKVTNRFKFIQKTKEIIDHRGNKVDDGVITIRWQFEKHEPITIDRYYRDHRPWRTPPYPSYPPYPKTYPPCYPIWCSTNPTIGADASTFKMASGILRGVEVQNFAPPDEGITVKGSRSSQEFVSGSTKDLEDNIYTICIHLKGAVQARGRRKKIAAPVTVRSKPTCPTCGNKCRSNMEYCSRCGTALF